ncbi:hypothetical protein ISS07_02455 [Candidatus Woesearchaeota archaeon]|nr:hypothetical protein [Candidatus Woesearchaeota archaeon]
MELLTYFLIAIISYLGLFIGSFLIKLAHEEQKPGKNYFILLKKIFFFLIIGFLLLLYNVNSLLSFIILSFIIILILNKKLNLEKNYLTYLLLGVIFFLSSKIQNLFVIESVLILLYGIPTASLLFNVKRKNYLEILKINSLFFVPVILLYFFL